MADVPIDLPAGTVAIKGPQRAGITATLVIGALAYAGLAPVVLATNHTTISVGVGGLTHQGLTPTSNLGQTIITLDVGALVFKGPQRLEVSSISLEAGGLALAGRTTGVLVDTPGGLVSIPAGVLAYQGLALDRIPTLPISMGVGSLRFSGQYVRVAFKDLGCGQLVYQGYAPTVNATISGGIALPAGAIQVAGPAFVPDFGVAIPVGALTITTPSMSVVSSGNIEIPSGSLVWTGHAPTQPPLFLAVPVGRVVFTSTAPFVDATRDLIAGALVFTGRTPAPLVTGVPVTNPDIVVFTVQVVRGYDAAGTVTRVVSSEVRR